MSAITGAGIDELRAAISQVVSRTRSIGWLNLLPSHGRLRAQLFEADAVREEVIGDDGGLNLYIDMDEIDFARLMREHDLGDRFTSDSLEPTAAPQ